MKPFSRSLAGRARCRLSGRRYMTVEEAGREPLSLRSGRSRCHATTAMACSRRWTLGVSLFTIRFPSPVYPPSSILACSLRTTHPLPYHHLSALVWSARTIVAHAAVLPLTSTSNSNPCTLPQHLLSRHSRPSWTLNSHHLVCRPHWTSTWMNRTHADHARINDRLAAIAPTTNPTARIHRLPRPVMAAKVDPPVTPLRRSRTVCPRHLAAMSGCPGPRDADTSAPQREHRLSCA